MAVKLHRCPLMWVKIDNHPCWRVQKALDEQGIEYELVKGPLRPASATISRASPGSAKYPVIEFEDGSVYRAESKEHGDADPRRRAARPAQRARTLDLATVSRSGGRESNPHH